MQFRTTVDLTPKVRLDCHARVDDQWAHPEANDVLLNHISLEGDPANEDLMSFLKPDVIQRVRRLVTNAFQAQRNTP